MNNGITDLQRNGFTAILVINCPARLNALTPGTLEQLLAHCHMLETDSEIRVVLLTSASKKALCVGIDIYCWTSLSVLDMWRNRIHRGHQVSNAPAQLPQPVVALLHGLAYGGGLELTATADIRICSVEAQTALSETGLAIVPGWSGTQRLTVLLGRSLVEEPVFTSEPLDVWRVLSYGLVNRVVARETLHDAGLQLAQRTVQRAPAAVQIVKQVIDVGEGIAVASTLEAPAGASSATTEDAHEDSQAFTEKRQPHFSAR